MSEIFNLSYLKSLVEKEKPPAIFVVDTNVVIRWVKENSTLNKPGILNWKTAFSSPVFLLSDTIVRELEKLKKRAAEKMERSKPYSADFENFITAIDCISNLTKEGDITKGISLKGTGIFISVSLPASSILDIELKQREQIVEAFGKSDAVLLLLAKECNQVIANIPIIFMTADKNLANMSRFEGISCCVYEGFDSQELEKAVGSLQQKNIDWNNVLEEILEQTAKRIVTVEMTLLSKKLMPGWSDEIKEDPCPDDLLYTLTIAEGNGIVRLPDGKKVAFSWSYPCYENPGGDDKIIVDFAYFEEDIDQDSKRGILEYLNGALQNYFEDTYVNVDDYLYFELNPIWLGGLIGKLEGKVTPGEELERVKRTQIDEDIKKAGGLEEYFIEQMLSDSIGDDEKRKLLHGLFGTIDSFNNKRWFIGGVKKFSFIPGQPGGVFQA
jgi:hypothetical protein